MIKKSILLGAPAAILSLAAIATPAQAAAPLAVTVPVAVPMVALGLSQADCGALPSSLAPQPLASPRGLAKSAAILGGQPSALEKMRMAQDGGAAANASHPLLTGITAPTTQLAPAALPMAAMGFGCAAMPQMRAALPQISATSIAMPQAPQGAFLGTERVRVGRTHFDTDWKRVANKGLSQRDLTAALGGDLAQDRSALLAQVNGWVNKQIRYRSDGRKDRWADARATLASRRGDCEDYAILKMQMLAAAGVAREDMMLTLARDTLRRADHAVLLVRHQGAWVMLDMASDRVAPAAQDYGYRPVMSFSAESRYIHGQAVMPQQPATVRIAYTN